MKWVKCGVMPNPKFRLKRPVALKVSRKNGEYWAETYWLHEFGVGPSMTAAMTDCMMALADGYEVLSEQRLGPYMQKIFNRWETYIERRK